MEGRDPASFRDPFGWVLHHQGRIFRRLAGDGAAVVAAFRQSGVYDALERDNLLLKSWPVDPPAGIPQAADAGATWVEHPVLPFISYPYEWSFGALKAAALHHLDLQIRALALGAGPIDATAYNIQFQGGCPTFIDLTSLQPYTPGEYWLGYKQFCEQFFYPLAMTAWSGIPFNALYAGSIHGIPAAYVRRMLPWHAKLRPSMLMHVVAADAAANRGEGASDIAKRRPFSRDAFRSLLAHLRSAIVKIEPQWANRSGWRTYTAAAPYDGDGMSAKKAFVERAIGVWRPDRVLDLGCNTGDFSLLALKSGAGLVVGAESDAGTADAAFARIRGGNDAFYPLVVDLTDPPGGRGWANGERPSLLDRVRPDAVMALAVVHHLAVAGIPLPAIVDWIASLAPRGILEFIPRDDPMLEGMAKRRKAPLLGYTEELFFERLQAAARIVRRETLPNGRIMISYERSAP